MKTNLSKPRKTKTAIQLLLENSTMTFLNLDRCGNFTDLKGNKVVLKPLKLDSNGVFEPK